MAMIKCPECGKEISDQTKKCIHCGYSIKRRGSSLGGLLSRVPLKVFLGIGILIVVICSGILIYNFNFSRDALYKKAGKAYEAENYESALSYYEKIGDFKDASERLSDTKVKYNYQLGKTNMENLKWEEARTCFENCGEYEDSTSMIIECDYNIALSLLEQKKYEEARSSFVDLDGYSESDRKIIECDYNIGLQKEEQGDLIAAAELFGKTCKFYDSKERIESIGQKYVEQGKYNEASKVFEYGGASLNGNKYYHYSNGKLALETKDYKKASSEFQSASGCLDAEALFQETTYQYANSLLNEKQYASALRQYNLIQGYKDVNDMKSVCDMLEAKDYLEKGELSKAKDMLDKMPAETEYKGTSVSELQKLLKTNSKWVSVCGRWSSTKGQMKSMQSGYSSRWWYYDFYEGELYVDVYCKILDSGKVVLSIKGQIPVYTNYSSVGSLLKQKDISLNKEVEVSKMGTIKINDLTTINISDGKVTVKYKKVDNTQDVYFTYTYTTEVTYGKKASSF